MAPVPQQVNQHGLVNGVWVTHSSPQILLVAGLVGPPILKVAHMYQSGFLVSGSFICYQT